MNSVDMNIVIGFAFLIAFCGTLIFMKKNGIKFGYYNEVKLALLIGGTMFKNAKVKEIMAICMGIVSGLEKADKSSAEKRKEAIEMAISQIYQNCNIQIDREIVGQIIDIAVANMPENQK